MRRYDRVFTIDGAPELGTLLLCWWSRDGQRLGRARCPRSTSFEAIKPNAAIFTLVHGRILLQLKISKARESLLAQCLRLPAHRRLSPNRFLYLTQKEGGHIVRAHSWEVSEVELVQLESSKSFVEAKMGECQGIHMLVKR